MDKDTLKNKIYQIAYLKGSFKLRSGQLSSEYFDKYQIISQSSILTATCKLLLEFLPKDCEVLAALEMGGIAFGVKLAELSQKPLCLVRKQAKNYGTAKLAEGSNIREKKLCIIEDIVTSGGQVIQSSQSLRKLGAQVTDVICLIDRNPKENQKKFQEHKLKLKSLFTKEDFQK